MFVRMQLCFGFICYFCAESLNHRRTHGVFLCLFLMLQVIDENYLNIKLTMQMSRCGPRHSPHSLVLRSVCSTQPPPRPASVLGYLTHKHTHSNTHTNHHYSHLEQNSQVLVMFMCRLLLQYRNQYQLLPSTE